MVCPLISAGRGAPPPPRRPCRSAARLHRTLAACRPPSSRSLRRRGPAAGRFTPCFTDIVVLGSAHLTAACLCAARLAQLLRRRSPQFRLLGASRAAHAAAAALSGGCLLVVLFQLNARLAADPTPLVSGRAAPFEWASYSLGLLSWALFLAIFLLELAGRYSPVATCLWRFPVFLVLAGQVAKLW